MDRNTVLAAAKNPEALQHGQEQMQAMLSRSATDAEFRRKLLSEPRVAIAEFTGAPVEALSSVNVAFIENKADATIVLPEYVSPTAELSEKDLEAVSGGSELLLLTIGAVTALVVVVDAAVDAYQAGQKSKAQ